MIDDVIVICTYKYIYVHFKVLSKRISYGIMLGKLQQWEKKIHDSGKFNQSSTNSDIPL